MRDASISIARGIAIIFMVMGHAGCPVEMRQFFALFHMPIFFFVSGCCLKDKYFEAPILYVRKRFSGVYWPFLKCGLLFVCLHNVFYHLHLYDIHYYFQGVSVGPYSLIDYIKHSGGGDAQPFW